MLPCSMLTRPSYQITTSSHFHVTGPLQDLGSSDATRAMLPCSMSRHILQAKQAPPQCCSVPLSPAAAATSWHMHDAAGLSQFTSPGPLQPCYHVPCYQRNPQTAKITSPLRGTPALATTKMAYWVWSILEYAHPLNCWRSPFSSKHQVSPPHRTPPHPHAPHMDHLTAN
jgi:hypothetical protein